MFLENNQARNILKILQYFQIVYFLPMKKGYLKIKNDIFNGNKMT